MNFGLAKVKKEGWGYSFDYPSLSWNGLRKEFEAYFNNKYSSKWYLKPFLQIIRKICVSAWDRALRESAKKEADK